MPNFFQFAAVQNDPFGLTQKTGPLPCLTELSFGVALFSYLLLATGSGWSPAPWAPLGGEAGCCGQANFTGPNIAQAGPMTGGDSNYDNWSSLLLLFAASPSGVSLVGDQTIASGAFSTTTTAIGFDVPAGSTMIAICQGTALFFPTTPVVTSFTDTADSAWSALITSNIAGGPGDLATTVVASVAFNTPHIATGTDFVTVNCAQGGNNSTAHVLVLSGLLPFTSGFSQGSMLL